MIFGVQFINLVFDPYIDIIYMFLPHKQNVSQQSHQRDGQTPGTSQATFNSNQSQTSSSHRVSESFSSINTGMN